MFLQLDPPPTLDGNDPSYIITSTVLVWSRIIISYLTGSIDFCTSNTGIPIFYDICCQTLFISYT